MRCPFEAGPQTTLTFAHRGCPASQVRTSAQGQTDTGHRKSAVVCPRADATSGQDMRRLLAQIRHYKVLQLEGGWAAANVMQRADMRSKRRAVSIAGSVTLALLPLASACFPPLPHAQSADLVLCARLAADPADPDKPKDVKGVLEIEASDVATAIKFCKVASAASRRALYQLGRAYAANRQLPEAVGAYR